jgi:hypothetical protein
LVLPKVPHLISSLISGCDNVCDSRSVSQHVEVVGMRQSFPPGLRLGAPSAWGCIFQVMVFDRTLADVSLVHTDMSRMAGG